MSIFFYGTRKAKGATPQLLRSVISERGRGTGVHSLIDCGQYVRHR